MEIYDLHLSHRICKLESQPLHQWVQRLPCAKTLYFLIFSISAAVLGVTSKLAGGYSLRTWRKDSLSTATAASLVAWAVTALAFGLVCKEINIGGSRGWRLKVLERLVIVLTFTQFLYLSVINAGFYNSRYGPN